MAEIRVKAGAQPPLLILLAALANEAASLASPTTVTITAGLDGTHLPRSKHYRLAAIDVRSTNFPSRTALTVFIGRLRARLGPGYLVQLEAEGGVGEHLHLQER